MNNLVSELLGDLQQTQWADEFSIDQQRAKGTKNRVAVEHLELEQLCKLASLVRKKDYTGIERLLRYGVSDLVNLVHPYDEIATVLSIAADLNDEEMVRFLITKKANPNVVDLKGRTAASRACEFGNVEALKVLLEEGTDVTITDIYENSILYNCVGTSQRHVTCARICLETGAMVDVTNKFGTPLFVAHCENAKNNEDVCILLLETGANADVMDKSTRRTALMAAAANGSLKVVKRILEYGCTNINEKMVNTRSHVTHDAAKSGNIEIMKLLSAYGADFDQQTSHAYCRSLTPMHIAAANDKALCCLFAGQRGTNATLKNREGLTPATVAKKAGYKATSKMCKQTEKFAPSKKKKKPKTRKPPLWVLKLHDFLYVREDALLDTFKNFDQFADNTVPINQFMQVVEQVKMPVPVEEKEAFMEIIAKHVEDEMVNYVKFLLGKLYIPKKLLMARYEKKVKRLRAAKGKVKANIPILTMPLSHKPHETIKVYQPVHDPFRFDIDHPPRNEIVNDSYWYMDAVEDRYASITDVIMRGDTITIERALDEGMDVEARSRYFKTPLMTAILNNNFYLVTKFVEAGANVNQRDNFLWTPLHLACHVGNLEIVQLLLRKGAKSSLVSINKALPLMRAVEAKALKVVQSLVTSKGPMDETDRKGLNVLELAAVWSDYYIFKFLKSQKIVEDKKKRKPARQKKKKHTSYKLPPITFKESLPPIMPPNPPTTIQTSMPFHQTRMIWTTSSKTYNDNLNEKLLFSPNAIWMKQKTTTELIEERMAKRKALGFNLDPDKQKSLVMENVEEKANVIMAELNSKVERPILKIKLRNKK